MSGSVVHLGYDMVLDSYLRKPQCFIASRRQAADRDRESEGPLVTRITDPLRYSDDNRLHESFHCKTPDKLPNVFCLRNRDGALRFHLNKTRSPRKQNQIAIR